MVRKTSNKSTKAQATKSLKAKITAVKTTKPSSRKSEEGVPLSQVIRKRIQAQKARFHANDNIAKFIKPGEIDGLIDEVAIKLQGVLESLVIDTESDHNTRGTEIGRAHV